MEPREVDWEARGDGPPVVFVHSDVADRRLWAAQAEALGAAHRVVLYDRPGYGRTPLPPGPFSEVEDLRGLLDRAGHERAAVVASSGGGRIAVEFALAYPRRVDRLVLVAAALRGWPSSAALEAADDEESRLFDAGEYEAAAELNVRLWADGTREAGAAPELVRDYVREATLRSYELWLAAERKGEVGPAERLDPPALERLGEIEAPTLVVVGAADQPDFLALADHLASAIPGSLGVVVPDAAHLLPLERPAELTRLLMEFLA